MKILGLIPYYDPSSYPTQFAVKNEGNRRRCIEMVYKFPKAFAMDNRTSECLNYPPSDLIQIKMSKRPKENVLIGSKNAHVNPTLSAKKPLLLQTYPRNISNNSFSQHKPPIVFQYSPANYLTFFPTHRIR